MAAIRLSSRGATRLAVAVALAGTALAAFLQPRGVSAPAPEAATALLFDPGDTTTIYGPRQIITPNGMAISYIDRFSVSVIPGRRYFLRMVNGASNGSNRVTGGTIRLNGWEIITSAEMGSGATIERVVQLRSIDTIAATVQGPAGAYVTVTVLETADPTFLVFGPGHFVRGSGTPVTETRIFAKGPTAAPPYRLCLTNGDVNGSNRVSSATITLNRQQVFDPSKFNQQVASLVATVSLQAANTLLVTLAGKPAGFVDLCVTATDTTPPVLTVTAPPQNFITRDTLVTVTGNVQDETPTTLTINGQAAPVGNSGFSKVVPLPVEGHNTITIVARDAAAHVTTVTRTVIRDRTPPVLTVNSPANGLITRDTTVVVSGTVSDSTPVRVNVNGTPLPVGQGGSFTGTISLHEGHNSLVITAIDTVNNTSSVPRTVIRDRIAPVLVVNAPADGFITKQTSITVSVTATDSNAVTVTVNGFQLTAGQNGAFSGAVPLIEGHNALLITARDAAGNETPATRTGVSDTQAPVIVVSSPGEGDTIATASVNVVGTVSDSTDVILTVNGDTVLNGHPGGFTKSVALVVGANTIALVATDQAGNVATLDRHVVRKNPLPPDPATVASVVNRAEATLVQENTSFLYTGASPIQTGVAPGTIAFLRAAVVRGRVLDRELQPLGGAVVAIRNHPELGQTLSREDGRYDLAVNGGGSLVLDFSKGGYLPAQRAVAVPWQDYTAVDDVVLLQPDPVVTVVDLTTQDIQVARGSSQTDADGSRQATAFFEPGTQATLRFADGSTQSLTSLNVRATEFTVGAHGGEAMPAELPPSSQYTYAVQVTADAQLAAPGSKITFNQPVPVYVENFLDFPVGTAVPAGAYDPVTASWQPRPNGMVVRITGTNAQGQALLDINGDGIADSDSLLLFNGIDPLERVRLAGTYPANSRLWRVPIIETLPYDLNWPFTLLGGDAPTTRVTGPCGSEGADVLRCNLQVQTAFQSVGIAGSPLTLNYASDRTQGNVADRQLKIDLIGATVPAFLERVDLDIDVAGKHFEAGFTPAANLSYTFTWDGKDGYGRTVQSTQPAVVRISYMYPVVYSKPAPVAQSFGLPCLDPAGACVISGLPPAEEDIRALRRVAEVIQTTLGGFDATGAGLGGFTLDVQHAYDPIGGMLYGGDGTRRVAATLPDQITRWAGTGDGGFVSSPIVNNVPKTQSIISDPAGVAVAPDGSVYIVDRFRNRVRKVDPNGIITTVAGTGVGGFFGDGGPATAARFSNPWGLALGPDGSLYIGDQANQRIRRVGPDGIITTIVGDGTCGFTGDGGPATAARICGPWGLGMAPDGSLYFTDNGNNRVRRIGSDGIIRTVAGTATVCFLPGSGIAPPGAFEATCGEGVPASKATLRLPTGLTLGPDGTVYFAQQAGGQFGERIRRIDPAGFIYLVAGGDVPLTQLGDGGSAKQARLGFTNATAIGVGPDGSIYFSTEGTTAPGFHRVRRVRPDGLITTVVGDGTNGSTGDNGPARRARIQRVEGIAFLQDGSMLISDDAKVRQVSPPLPGLAGGQTVIASADGSELYVFSPAGRILVTLDPLTADTIQRFVYDGQRRLVAITDRDGGTTTIERDGAGRPTRILAPNGQPTVVTLRSDGTIAALTDAGNEALQLEFDTSGLLNGITDFNGNSPSLEYDASGRLLTSSGGPGAPPIVRSVVTTASGDEHHYTSAGGVESFGQVADLPGGGRSYQGTLPDGRVMATTVGPDGTVTTHFADGTVTTAVPLPDPVFGMQSPGSRVTTTLPSGLVHDQRGVRAVTLAIPGDPLSLTTQVDSLVINGRISLTTFDKVAGTRTRRTPSGRVAVTTLDAAGRDSSEQVPGMFPVSYQYDSAGRVTRIAQSARIDNWIYGPNGLPHRSTDALGRVALRSYTATGLLTELIRPGGDTVRFEYDANGNRTVIVPPGRSPHLFGFSATGRRETYTAPAVGPTPTITRWSYNADGALIGVELPDGGDVVLGRDSAGQVRTVTSPTGQQTYAYDPGTGRVATTVSEHGVVTSFTYDGSLLKSMEWSGPAVGKVSNTYDANHWLISQAVGNGPPIQFENELDGLPTRAGALTISRDAASGAITGTTLGGLTSQWVMDGYGDLASLEYRFGSAVVLRLAYTRDGLARVVAVSEVRNSDSTGTAFGFDSVGGLTSVVENGVPVASYEYDANGNRTLVTTPSGTMQGIIDAQDRLLALGGTSYKYSANGQLVEKVSGNDTTRYEYDGALRLTAVSLPSGRGVSYLLDADGRRVGRAIDGVVERRFVYASGFKLLAEVDGTGSATSRFVYGTRANVPDYMVKDGAVYGLVTDQAGSVRLVIDVTNGAVAQALDYDAFGRITLNTNPGFQPFAFAGGLLDYETGLIHFGVRDYDPYAGRWTSKDPILFDGGDWNLYAYARNDPINSIDPTGTWSLPEMAFTMGWQTLLKYVRNRFIEEAFASILEKAITGCITGDLSVHGQKKGCFAGARDEVWSLSGLVGVGTDVVTSSANPFAQFVINCGADGVMDMIDEDLNTQAKSLFSGCLEGGLKELVDISLHAVKAMGPVARAVSIAARATIGVAFIIAEKRYMALCENEPRNPRCRLN
jgi:RHS repeat-associated protein